MVAFIVPGGPELLMIGAIILLLFGAKLLPRWAKGLVDTRKEIRKAFDEDEEDKKE